MKQLTLTLTIDPALAIRAGKAKVGETTVTLTDSDLAQLTEDQRDTLARHVAKERSLGYGCGIEDWDTPLTQYHSVADIAIPTIAKLLDLRRVNVQAAGAEKAAREAEKQEEADENARKEIALRPAKTRYLRSGGVVHDYSGTLPIDLLTRVYKSSELSPAASGEVETYNEFVETENVRRIAAAIPELEKLLQEQAAAKVAEEEAYQREIQRLPEVFQRRINAGYATKREVEQALIELFISDAYCTLAKRDWMDEEDLKYLTDSEFEALERLKTSGVPPEGAKVEPKTIYEKNLYRKATDDDDLEDIDSDGDVQRTPEERGACNVAVVTWERVGIEISVAFPLS